MLSEPARIRSVSSDVIELETSRKSTCSKCSVKGGCGQHLFDRGTEILRLSPRALDAGGRVLVPGARVRLGLPEGAVARLALLFYALPLALLLLCTFTASLWTASEGVLITSALGGLLTGLLALPLAERILSRHFPAGPMPCQPQASNPIPESIDESLPV